MKLRTFILGLLAVLVVYGQAISVSKDYTAAVGDRGKTIIVNSANNVNIFLPYKPSAPWYVGVTCASTGTWAMAQGSNV